MYLENWQVIVFALTLVLLLCIVLFARVPALSRLADRFLDGFQRRIWQPIDQRFVQRMEQHSREKAQKSLDENLEHLRANEMEKLYREQNRS
jgi:ABC-type siderophore export system fused ATPase/permease subunit